MSENTLITVKDQSYIKYDLVNYRGFEIQIISDLNGDYYYFRCGDEIVDLGYHPLKVKETIKGFIDKRLDIIIRFSGELTGGILEYFNNCGYRDIRLSYFGRVLKVFLVADEIDRISLIAEAENILKKFINTFITD